MRTLLAFLMTLLLFPGISLAREWTSGQHKIEADFVKMDGDKVVLQGSNGKQYRIPLEKLSEADQAIAKKLADAGNGDAPKPHSSSEAPVNEKDLQTVRAEGVGSTGDEALKDAFRNAVRQVVGAVVDADTMTKNDQVIDDKVLTYSDGFVKHYEEISKKSQGSLIRIKVEAKVERRSVVEKLKAANVTTAKVDGKSMFAEVISDEEAKKNATQLLAKALTPLPTLLTAELDGKPVPDRERNELVFKVILRPDLKAFDSFRTQLRELLNKIALSRREVMLDARVDEHEQNRIPPGFTILGRLGRGRVDKWELVVNVADYGNHMRTKWNAYTVDAALESCLAPLAGATFVTLTMLDSSGTVVTEDEMPITAKRRRDDWQPVGGPRHYDDGWFVGPMMRLANANNYDEERRLHYTSAIIIAPYTMAWSGNNDAAFYYSPYAIVSHRTRISLEELKRIAEIKCKVEYRPVAHPKDPGQYRRGPDPY